MRMTRELLRVLTSCNGPVADARSLHDVDEKNEGEIVGVDELAVTNLLTITYNPATTE